MPLLGAIGNASEYSFRGTYDNYPSDINLVDLIDAEPGQIYTTSFELKDVNYKIPISITGDGEYTIDNINYSTQPTYIRNGDNISIRILSVQPNILQNNLTVVDRSFNSYSISLNSNISVELRSGTTTFNPNGSTQFDNRTFQGSEVGFEYYNKTYSTAITLGKENFTWTIQTKKGGKAENLTFTDVNDVEFSSEMISNTYTVQGLADALNYTAEIISNEGLLSVNYREFVNSATVKNGDIVRLKLTSSNLNFTQKTATIRISLDVSPDVQTTASWNVKTLDRVPSGLSFTPIFNAELNTEILSEVVRIEGLSNNINFNVSITSSDGLLSVNGGPFGKFSTIRNGQTLQLKLATTGIWLQEKIVTVLLENTIANWRVANRTIGANIDSNASNLIFSIPFNTINQVQDTSPEVRLKNSLSQGLRATSLVTTIPGRTSPAISVEQSKYYGNTGSFKLAKGITTKTFEVTGMVVNTDQTQSIGLSDFTMELWMRFSGFNFGGEVGMSINYPSYIDNRNINDYFFQLFVKGDNWQNSFQFKRGLLLGYPDSNGVVRPICETMSQVLALNSWNHIALTRSGSTFRIWVNGINYASGFSYMDLTSKNYNFLLPNFQRLISDDVYVQDLRLYKGVAKYTSNFNPANVTPIMEPFSP